MKKLIIGVVAVAIATAVHAAQVSWTIEKDTPKTFGNLTAYVVDGANYATVAALLDAGGDSVATAFNSYVIDSAALNSRGAGGSEADGVTGSTLAWFIFDDNKIEDGGAYNTTGALDVSSYKFTPPESNPGDFTLTVDSFTTRGAPIGSSSVPEPTSGLLVVLGMAGLALRRKRA